jgi:hypothetical protein
VREYEISFACWPTGVYTALLANCSPTPSGPRDGRNFLKTEGIFLVKPWKGNPKERKPQELTS